MAPRCKLGASFLPIKVFFIISILILYASQIYCQKIVQKNQKKFTFSKKIAPTDLLQKYKAYHKKACNSNVKCSEKEFILFKPVAGLGDSLNAMEAAFIEALKSGNLFFIDWKYFNPALTFTWKQTHFYRDKIENCDISKICAPKIEVEGHLTFDHDVLKLPKVNEIPLSLVNSGKIKQYLMKPSKILEKMIEEEIKDFKCDAGVVIRTGENDYNEFLDKSDHEIFTQCIKNHHPPLKNIFLTSDSLTAKNSVERNLKNFNVNVKTIKDSYIHISDLSIRSRNDEKVLKTFLEFHLISKCRYNFLTQNSLFGEVASKLVDVDKDSGRNYYISHRFCDDKIKILKESYVFCASPKYPGFCRVEDIFGKNEL